MLISYHYTNDIVSIYYQLGNVSISCQSCINIMSKMYQYHVNNVSILRGYCINTSFIIIMHSQLGLEFGNIVVTMTVAVMGWKGRNLFVANKANIMLMLIPNPIEKVKGETVEVITR